MARDPSPLTTSGGQRIGTVCVFDPAPRDGLSDEAKATMQKLALEEIEKLSKANDACGQIYDQLLLYLKYNNEFAWR